jgi:hypothetical protein
MRRGSLREVGGLYIQRRLGGPANRQLHESAVMLRFKRSSTNILVLLIGGLMFQGVQAQDVHFQPGAFDNDIPTFVYDPASGNVAFYGDGHTLTTLQIVSSQALFLPENVNAGVLSSPFDVFTSAKFFHLNTGGFESIDLGPVLPPGLTFDLLRDDLTFSGSIRPAGLLPGVDVPVPEPAAWSMMLVLLPVLARARARRCDLRPTSDPR